MEFQESGSALASGNSDTAQIAAFRALHAVTKSVHASLDLTQTLDAVARGVVAATGFGVAIVNLRLTNGDFQVVSVEGSLEARSDLLGLIEPATQWQQIMDGAQQWGELKFVAHDDELAAYKGALVRVAEPYGQDEAEMWHPRDSLFAPLMAPAGGLVGVLSVDLPDGGRRPGPDQLEMLTLFADHAAIAIEHARMHSTLRNSRDELEHLATHDQLTGLANRALLMSRAASLASIPHSRLGVLVLDLDGFKALNDAAGHHAGDELLTVLGKRMRGCVRDSDVLARSGGDEFVVVSCGPDIEQTLSELATRLEAAITEPVRGQAGLYRVGVSIGSAIAQTPAEFDRLLATADADMYRVKRARKSE